MSSKLEVKAEEMNNNISEFPERVLAALLMYADTQAVKLRSYMQLNRPWRDRTGEAKRRLNAQAYKKSNETIVIVLSQGVDYGVWLELANSSKYAIIKPTLNNKSSEVKDGLTNLLSKIK